MKILIIADIEGSSGCFSRESARFLGQGWPGACLGMSLDVRAVVKALFNAGATKIRIQDFHRTGRNLFPGLIPDQAKLVQGYSNGRVPGMADPNGYTRVMMLGMHAPSGEKGFLAHTLTSRVGRVTANGKPVSEAQLFSAALAEAGISPAFFSGCPAACAHTGKVIPGLPCFPIDKTSPGFDAEAWRRRMAGAAADALKESPLPPYAPKGPFRVCVTMAGGPKAARAIALKWGHAFKGPDIFLDVPDLAALFRELSRMLYFTPLTYSLLPVILPVYHLAGRAGLFWAHKKAAPARNPDRG